jgi:uncharacterized protein (UPF0332 family)
MKKEKFDELIRYRLERSREALDEAIILKRENHWNACVNRLYYSCFYAVSALLHTGGMSSSKHSGVKALFNQHWVKTGKITKDKGRFYNQLFESRQEADYIDFVKYEQEMVEPWISQAGKFIDCIAKLCRKV